jgi:hypothetical protein
MAATRRKELTPEAQTAALEKLRDMLSKPKEKASSGKMAFIKQAEPEISGLLEKGYSMKDILDSLNESGIEITSGTFHSYWNRIKAEKAATAPKLKSKKPAETPAKKGAKPGAHIKSTVAEQAAEISPPGTGTVKPTDLKGGKAKLFGNKE